MMKITAMLFLSATISVVCVAKNSSVIPDEYKAICDYYHFLSTDNPTTSDSIAKAELYFEVLGIIDELAEYRQQFLQSGNFINLFPTAYFHTTAKETVNISNGGYDYPIEKMKQMVSFYEAYKINRNHWETGNLNKIENHWKSHFKINDVDYFWIMQQITIDPNYDINGAPLVYMQTALNSAINAHVNFDLGRAIRYAYNNRYDVSLTEIQLKKDFDDTDPIFSNTQTRTLEDFRSIYHFSLWPFPVSFWDWFAGKFGPDVISMRKNAWKSAFDGSNLLAHPTGLKHDNLIQKGKKLCPSPTPSLFLIDVSGSMKDNNKMTQARQAALSTLNSIEQQNANNTEIGIMVYSGGCSPSSASLVQNFTTNFDEVRQTIENHNKLQYPSGKTPLPHAIARAENELNNRLQQNGQSCGELIILGDGQSTCGNLRPPQAYAGVESRPICGQGNSAQASNITYFTVGFGIPPGSEAERDLQYLANKSGGKYFNAQNQYQLTRAFEKIKQTYVPIYRPQTAALTSESSSNFYMANQFIDQELYDTALVLLKTFIHQYPADSSGLYNTALMYEANDQYKSAISFYQEYLDQSPNTPKRAAVEKKIQTLTKDYEQLVSYLKSYLQADLDYLESHYQQLLQSHNAVGLAGEFSGFLQEKYFYYQKLPERLEMEQPWIRQYCNDIVAALEQTVYFLDSNPGQWDFNGVSMLGNVYYPLEKMVSKLQ